MRPTFLQGKILLEELCWSSASSQSSCVAFYALGLPWGATDTAGTFTPNAEHRAKLAHKARAHGAPLWMQGRISEQAR